MSVRIRLAQSAEDLDAVFQLRHRVFSEQEGYIAASGDSRMVDRFDAFPTTGTVIAENAGHAVGTSRVTEYSSAGTSTDEWFDFTPHLPTGVRAGSASMLAVDRKLRDVPGLVFSMMAMLYSWAAGRGITVLTAATNPDVIDFATRHGWRPVGAQGFSADHGLPFVPMVLSFSDLPERFVHFQEKHEKSHLFDQFERDFYNPGERLFAAGDSADAAYIIIDGEVSVVLPNGQTVNTLRSGDLVGELALINESPRSATVVASTELTVMVIDRGSFLKTMDNDLPTARALMRIVARRVVGIVPQNSDG